jgi:hypothetical protein
MADSNPVRTMEAVVSDPARLRLGQYLVCVLESPQNLQLKKRLVGDLLLGHAVLFERDHHVMSLCFLIPKSSRNDLSSHSGSCVSGHEVMEVNMPTPWLFLARSCL